MVALELELEDGKTITGRLHDVLYVPELAYNLLSISKFAKCGKRVNFYKSHCEIIDNNERVVATGTKSILFMFSTISSSSRVMHN